MKTRDLCVEMRQAVDAMERRDVDELVQLGIPEIFIEHFQMVGVARIREDRSRTLYEPDPLGRWHWITPVCVQYPDTPESTQPEAFPLIGDLVDLVAWHERDPKRWLLRTGAASWIGAIEPQFMQPARVRIWRSPLSWLRGHCTGLVPLARERGEVYRLLAGCSTGLVAEDEQHAAALRDILRHPWPSPPVYAGAHEERRYAA